MSIFAPDGRDGTLNEGLEIMTLWVTSTSGSAGDWITSYPTDTTNPAGLTGGSYRTADADNAEALDGTCAVALEAWTAAGWVRCAIRGIVDTCNVADAVATPGALSIGSTAGRAIAYTGTNPELRVIGRSLAAASSNNARTLIYKHPRFA